MSAQPQMRMLVKCETKSNRVKGVSFHPRHAWILASLHNGAVQLWDYRLGGLIETFDEHEGPVRGVCFHRQQPLFVSGGDDYKIKVWNYQFRRCLFTLLGHLDYIRTVEFHVEQPWIASASDDQTVRLWNWQTRNCLAVLTGHNHYVMCANFHPTDELLVSASLDQTVRVWDTSSLRMKSKDAKEDQKLDVFGSSDATVKHVLDGHDRGVNWACFHPTMPLVASVADDRTVKLWRMSDSKAWEIDTLRGHFNNVSCVLFHHSKDLIVSNSEDRTIRVWDGSSRTAVHTFRREHDRFWVIAQHPTNALLAVGHDSGLVVFKLDRERPAAMALGSSLFYCNERQVVQRDLDAAGCGADKQLASCRRAANAMVSGIRSLEVNPYSQGSPAILVTYDATSNGTDFVPTAGYDIMSSENATGFGLETKQGQGQMVAFTTRNRFAVLMPGGQIGVRNLQDELSKTFDPPVPTKFIHLGGNNRVMLREDDRAHLYDLTSRKIVGSCAPPAGTRYVIWSPNMAMVAFVAKHAVLVADKNLKVLHTVHEPVRVKSGAWDENGAFLYATASHVKYCLPQTGDAAVLYALDAPVYIVRAHKGQVFYLDRSTAVHKRKYDPTEYLFKLALHQRRYADVKSHLKSARLCGNVIIGYLKKRGHPEVALHFVQDAPTRFNLALEYGHLEEALPAAQQMDDPAAWSRLGREALRQGNQQMVEMVYQKTKNFDGLTFLYMLTGNFDKLRKMLIIAERRQDTMARYHAALFCGDVEQRVKVLAECGQVALAALTARTHGLTELLEPLEESLGRPVSSAPGAALLLPPQPVCSGAANWPCSADRGDPFANSLANAEVGRADAPPEEPVYADALEEFNEVEEDALGADLDLGAWGGDLDLGADADLPDLPPEKPGAGGMLQRGESAATKWLRARKLAADLVAAGDFGEAFNLLERRIGLMSAAPLQPLFLRAYAAAQCAVPGLPATPALQVPLLASGSLRDRALSPFLLYNYGYLQEQQKEAAKLFTKGAFADALKAYQHLLQSLVLAVATTQEEDQGLQELVATSAQYVTALRLETSRKALPESDVARGVELVAYLTCCKLAAPHMTLTLQVAMTTAFKAQNFLTAAYFAKRLLQGFSGGYKPPAELQTKARKVLQVCESKATDAVPINFDQRTAGMEGSITLCNHTFKPIPANAAVVLCPFCSSSFLPDRAGSLCDVCGLAKVGASTLGLQFRQL